ncbi:HpcH/HpaI aldolase/citrate lyase family protein [Nitrospirillum iridis]|uniref:Citrate lyase subunit beta/citryl-CoA lyase n=1 Tax=Nitrospirillum iridis TaxID=765888 RepID=A0A7X0ATW9_9PROT|nr:CoA ester lyase [Nitrospirillum iridis]MBB6249632.1 citrate lyase subunit beta/citryl-CoA lyase [Nitrospirillum iridis]
MTARPRRSALYMPGSNARALEKATALPADMLILDLEDAVAPDAKDLAREQVLSAVAGGGFGRRELLIRTNGLDTPWGLADLTAAATSGAHGVLIPKVESAEAVRQADRLLTAAGAPPDLALWVMMETALGMLNAKEIASASPRLAGMVLGTSDLAKELHAHHTALRLPMITALGLCLLAARAHGLAILDGVHLDLEDEAGLEAACRQGVELGFDGKTLIHPKQLDAANRAFAPDAAALEHARRLIAAHAEAMAEGKAVVLVDGRLVEALHVAEARRLVALAAAIGG